MSRAAHIYPYHIWKGALTLGVLESIRLPELFIRIVITSSSLCCLLLCLFYNGPHQLVVAFKIAQFIGLLCEHQLLLLGWPSKGLGILLDVDILAALADYGLLSELLELSRQSVACSSGSWDEKQLLLLHDVLCRLGVIPLCISI